MKAVSHQLPKPPGHYSVQLTLPRVGAPSDRCCLAGVEHEGEGTQSTQKNLNLSGRWEPWELAHHTAETILRQGGRQRDMCACCFICCQSSRLHPRLCPIPHSSARTSRLWMRTTAHLARRKLTSTCCQSEVCCMISCASTCHLSPTAFEAEWRRRRGRQSRTPR